MSASAYLNIGFRRLCWCLFLLLLLYNLIRYITFRPLLKFYYWQQPPRRNTGFSAGLAANRRGTENKATESEQAGTAYVDIQGDSSVTIDGQTVAELDHEQVTVKYFVDVTKLKAGQQILLAGEDYVAPVVDNEDDAAEPAPLVINLAGIRSRDKFAFTKLGEGRRVKLKIDSRVLVRLRNRRLFRGTYLKNGY